MDVSVVVPLYNEEGSVKELHSEILSICRKLEKTFEIIFVDDGSTDNTAAVLRTLSPVTVLRLRRNSGQTAALDAGIKAAQGNVVITMDGDLQNDPADIPKLLAKLEEGYDVVSGWRRHRKDPLLKRVVSRVAFGLRQYWVRDEIHDSGCTLKAYRGDCLKTLDLYGEMHRFIPALLRIRGYRITEIEVNHRARKYGYTKYNWRRTCKGLLDMIAVWFWKKYANRPLHLFGGIGLFLVMLSIIGAAGLLYYKFGLHSDLSDTVLTEATFFCLLIGIQLIVFGLLADILSKTYYASTKTKPYEIEERRTQ